MGVQVQPLKRRFLISPHLIPRRLSEVAATPQRGVTPRDSVGLEGTGVNPPRFALSLLYRHPTVIAATLYLLILSGLPRFRIRDPEASLRGDMDWVVTLHAAVWGIGSLWVLWQIGRRFQARRRLLRLRLPQVLGLAMILALAVSVWKSDAPVLTNFKVYQAIYYVPSIRLYGRSDTFWPSCNGLLGLGRGAAPDICVLEEKAAANPWG